MINQLFYVLKYAHVDIRTAFTVGVGLITIIVIILCQEGREEIGRQMSPLFI